MSRNKLLKNTFLLILGGFITKILGFIIKILYTRYLKNEGVSLIMLIFPTYSLLLTISGFALPLGVMKLTAEQKIRKSKILFSSFWISMFINTIIIMLVIIFANFFSTTILHEPRCSILIIILCVTLPFVSTTSLIKAYFFGSENIKPIIFSNVSEEIIKLIMVILFLPNMINKGIFYGVIFYLFINIICEIISFIILFIFLPKRINIKKLSYKYDNKCVNNLTKIALPTLLGRIVGNLGYFFEPIILTNLLIYKGFNSSYIRLNYGYFQGYVIAILTLPSFFLLALSNNLVPQISKLKVHNKYQKIKKISYKIIITIFFAAVIYMLFLYFFGKNIMYILYNTTKGYKYLKTLLPFFAFFYLESPFIAILQGLDQEKKIFKVTTFGIIVKYISLVLLIYFNCGFVSLIISEIINILFVISLYIYYLNKSFHCLSQ